MSMSAYTYISETLQGNVQLLIDYVRELDVNIFAGATVSLGAFDFIYIVDSTGEPTAPPVLQPAPIPEPAVQHKIPIQFNLDDIAPGKLHMNA